MDELSKNNNCTLNDIKKIKDEIKSLNFAVIELNLYLDTHPEDRRALMMHNEYTSKLNDLKNKFEQMYGPLSIYYPYNEWGWQTDLWPWERGNY